MRLGTWARHGTAVLLVAIGTSACTVVRAPQGDGAPFVGGRVRQVGPGAGGAALRVAANDFGGAPGRAVAVLVPSGTPVLDTDGRPVERVRLGDDVLVWTAAEPREGAPVVATMIVATPGGYAAR
jgi:hypothetical protein